MFETNVIQRGFAELLPSEMAAVTTFVDHCIFSFVEMYKKLETNMPELTPLTDTEKSALAKGFGEIPANYGLFLQTCGTNGDYSQCE